MSAYRDEDLEAVHTRALLQDWAGQGWITPAQREQMEQETVCGLRRTNIFLRVVLFFFTKIIVGAAAGLFFIVLFPHASSDVTGIILLFIAAALYWAAEQAVADAKLYRHGIEEALACGAVLFLCVGLQSVLPREAEFLMPAAGAGACLWIWRRFGFPYAVPAAMAFVVWLPVYWTKSPGFHRLHAAALFAAGLVVLRHARPSQGLTHLRQQYSLAEAFLCLGVYCAVNLPLSTLDFFRPWMGGTQMTAMAAIAKPLYWFTWVLIWCLPPVILLRGVRGKDRALIAVGMVTAVLTLVTNRAYLGWERHTWDPMLLGLLLGGTALLLRRWLESAPDGVRAGFTARRRSGNDQAMIDAGGGVIGLAAPGLTAAPASPVAPDNAPRFGGGQSGGGGASSDF